MISRGFSEPTDRVKRLKKAIVDAIPYVESERAVLVTESYKETEGLSPIMRRAKAAEKIFNNLPITIHEDELIVGAITKSADLHSQSSHRHNIRLPVHDPQKRCLFRKTVLSYRDRRPLL